MVAGTNLTPVERSLFYWRCVKQILQRSPLLFHLSFVICSTCGTGCWEDSSTRISGLERARVSALLPHSMRKSGWALRVSLAELFLFLNFYFEVTVDFSKLQRSLLGGVVWYTPPPLSPIVNTLHSYSVMTIPGNQY